MKREKVGRFVILQIALLFFVSALVMGNAHAEYLHPALATDASVTAENVSSSDILFPEHLDKTIIRVLNDQDQKISREFQIPTHLRKYTEFWFKIYSLYTSHQVVLYDQKDPSIIYEVLDFRDLFQHSKNRVVYEILKENKIRAATKRFKAAFVSLAQKKKPRTREELLVYSALRKKGFRTEGYLKMSKTLRSQTGQRDFVYKGLKDASPYWDAIEKIFFTYGIPKEVARLCLVESSFNELATSRSGARGVWQFMLTSGKEYLYIDKKSEIDERLSPLKSTLAAAQLLKRNYKTLDNWILAIIAYNSGTRPLINVSKKSKVNKNTLARFILSSKETGHLGYAGQNYYSEFLAMLYLDSYKELVFNIHPESESKVSSRFTRLKEKSSLSQIGILNNVSLNQLRKLNPDIPNINTVLPRGFLIAIPDDNHNIHLLVEDKSLYRSITRAQLN